MAQRWVLASNTTSGDRLLDVGQAAIQLSDGTLVFLAEDPSASGGNKIQLYYSSDHIATNSITTVTAGSSQFALASAPQSLALVRDSSDNLYVVGVDTSNTDHLAIKAYKKGTGYTWNAAAYVHADTGASEDLVPTGFAALWCNTGSGTNGKGHILAMWNTTNGTNGYAIYDAGAALNGSISVTDSGTNPTFMGTGNSAVDGSNIDLDPDGFGATTGMAVTANTTTGVTVGSWGVSTSGRLTTSTNFQATFTTGTLGSTSKVRCIRYASNAWVGLWNSSSHAGQITTQAFSSSASQGAVDSGTASNFPSPAAGLSWGAATTATSGTTVNIYGWSAATATTMLRVPVSLSTPSAPTVGATVTEDTSVGSGTNTTIRVIKSPTAPLKTDWQTYNSTSPYSLLGDYGSLPTSPNPPTLLTPANNTTQPLSQGFTFTWSFTSGVSGDSQTAFYFRRQKVGGAYEYWTGSAWQGSEIKVTSTAKQVVFAAALWTPATTYNWSVDVEGSTGLRGGYAADFVVASTNSPPAVPKIGSATYDSANNRVTVVANGQDNYLTANEASLGTDTTGWAAQSNTTIARVATPSVDGSGALRLTSTASGDIGANTPVGTSGIAVIAGNQYTASAAFQTAASARTAKALIYWYDSGGSLLSQSVGTGITDSTSGFTAPTNPASVTASAPANAAFASVGVNVLATGGASEIHYIDQVALVPGASVTWTRGGLVGTNTMLVEGSDDVGVTWFTVRGASAVAIPTGAQSITVYDYEAPPSATRYYRATTQTTDAPPQSSVASDSLGATPSITTYWLKDPIDSTANITLNVVPGLKSQFREVLAAHYPLGRTRPVVISDVITGEDVPSMTVTTLTTADLTALTTIINRQRTLLLQSPFGGQTYIRIVSDRVKLHEADAASSPLYRTTFGYLAVDVP